MNRNNEPVILDTSGILVVLDEEHELHRAVARIVSSGRRLIVSPFIVAEADYMLYKKGGSAVARTFAEDVVDGAYELANWSTEDHAEAVRLLNRHSKYVGVADASNVVLADRYRTTSLLTLDQRHFRELRPIWGADCFTLLPFDI